MLHGAAGYHADVTPGRFVIETEFRRRSWAVIVEPDSIERLLVVITAYRIDP